MNSNQRTRFRDEINQIMFDYPQRDYIYGFRKVRLIFLFKLFEFDSGFRLGCFDFLKLHIFNAIFAQQKIKTSRKITPIFLKLTFNLDIFKRL
ncbi:hypothetical protein THIOM_002900 [Candidatus Thiomargarita nelsonii]|uniref:Uncharacterized protein n=1 Tax=Candidatus Thiomargarita nelsonii TaxID=1003181 RepID=A0A176S0A5_9GAMM|nr:hypothetical protein THIOM_002900 [Candidatus Thiomargarita nelsonii]